jgi:hypothetical protein
MTGEDPVVRKGSQSGIDPASVSSDKDFRGNYYVCIRLTSPGIYPGKLLAGHALREAGVGHSFQVVAYPAAIVLKIYIP